MGEKSNGFGEKGEGISQDSHSLLTTTRLLVFLPCSKIVSLDGGVAVVVEDSSLPFLISCLVSFQNILDDSRESSELRGTMMRVKVICLKIRSRPFHHLTWL